jgi:hypothetical protein
VRSAIARLAFSLTALLALAPAVARADDLPVPRGSRASGADALISSTGFGPTVEHVTKELAHRGLAFHRVGPYRAHGVDVTRWLADDERSPWRAIHVFRSHGKTWISFVKRAP